MARQTLETPTRRLWIALLIILLFLGLNALSTIQGWSPFANIAQEHIQSKTTPESLRQRVSPRKEEPKPEHQSLIPPDGQSPPPAAQRSTHNSTQTNAAVAVPPLGTPDVTQPAPSDWTQHAPYAPVAPIAPQQTLKQPVRPVPPQPMTYQVIYPDGTVRQITYPPYYYPQPATTPAQ